MLDIIVTIVSVIAALIIVAHYFGQPVVTALNNHILRRFHGQLRKSTWQIIRSKGVLLVMMDQKLRWPEGWHTVHFDSKEVEITVTDGCAHFSIPPDEAPPTLFDVRTILPGGVADSGVAFRLDNLGLTSDERSPANHIYLCREPVA